MWGVAEKILNLLSISIFLANELGLMRKNFVGHLEIDRRKILAHTHTLASTGKKKEILHWLLR